MKLSLSELVFLMFLYLKLTKQVDFSYLIVLLPLVIQIVVKITLEVIKKYKK